MAGDHVVVFADRVFRYRGGDRAGRAEAEAYARSVGVPEHQFGLAGLTRRRRLPDVLVR